MEGLSILIMIVAFCVLFIVMILAFYCKDKSLEKGEIRKSITITFVIMYIVFLCFSLGPITSDNPPQNNTTLYFGENNVFINNFHNAILVILAFYFGSRAFEVGMGARDKVRDWAKNVFSIPTKDMITATLKKNIEKQIEDEKNRIDEIIKKGKEEKITEKELNELTVRTQKLKDWLKNIIEKE